MHKQEEEIHFNIVGLIAANFFHQTIFKREFSISTENSASHTLDPKNSNNTKEHLAILQKHAMQSTALLDVILPMNDSYLFDFRTSRSVDNWIEQSDVVREVGMSKAVLVLQKTRIFQRAVFFTLLNPQPNGAGFAGVRCNVNFDLSKMKSIQMSIRGQGNNYGYKVVLRHKGLNDEPNPTYEQFFNAPVDVFDSIPLPLDEFKPYYRGRQLNSTEAEPLDTSNITSFGLQVYGGVYLPIKQKGSSSLEIDWIKAV